MGAHRVVSSLSQIFVYHWKKKKRNEYIRSSITTYGWLNNSG